MARLFGTDGVRGVANQPPLTPEGVVALGRAFALERGVPHPRVVMGRDTRASSPMLADAFRAGLLAQGARVVDGGILPTPAVAVEVVRRSADGGVVITASHNPARDNGVKFMDGRGHKLSDAGEEAIERRIRMGAYPDHDPLSGGSSQFCWEEASTCYVRSLKPWTVDARRLTLVVDAAHGAASAIAILALQATAARAIHPLGNQPDGRNINHEVGATHPQAVMEKVRLTGADVGIALDGDGDRVVMVDEEGRGVDGDVLLGILALHRLEKEGVLPGGLVVGTVMTNGGLEAKLKEEGIQLLRTPVGDRHVAEALRARGGALGGEPSGHILLPEEAPSGDGLRAALAILRVMVDTGWPLSRLADRIPHFPQVLRMVDASHKPEISSMARLCAAIRRVEEALASRGRVLVRWSGTEPRLRVMVEGPDPAQVEALAEILCQAAREDLE